MVESALGREPTRSDGLTGYLLRETAISVALNLAGGGLFCWLRYHAEGPIHVWGTTSFAFDLFAGTLMVTATAGYVVTILANQKLAKRQAPSHALEAMIRRLPDGLAARVTAITFAVSLILPLIFLLPLTLAGVERLSFPAFFCLRELSNAVLALVLTPVLILKSIQPIRRDDPLR